MLEFRLHARGGQGAVMLGRMLASAFFSEGNYVQTFPTFGAERRGSPVMAFLRVDENPIRERCAMLSPDHIIVLSDNLFDEPHLNVTEGLKPGGFVLINTAKPVEDFAALDDFRVVPFDCSPIALQHKLGTPPTLIVNTVLLGAFARITGLINMSGAEVGLKRWLPASVFERNYAAALAAYEAAVPHIRSVTAHIADSA